ncbi:MAG TPA: SRPBCC family protein [Candidatus Eisenbacteria bacterium]|jgi:uncharacterized protein YndB with AHSA1/START domain
MTKTAFVYVTYISAPQEKVWKALTDREFTRQYWAHDNVSDWKPGSTWEHRESEAPHTLKLVGKVVEFTPPRRLVMTWAAPPDAGNPAAHSRVTIELQNIDGMVKLTVTHDELDSGSSMLQGISEGWPRVLSSLKSLLETGKALPTWAKVKS